MKTNQVVRVDLTSAPSRRITVGLWCSALLSLLLGLPVGAAERQEVRGHVPEAVKRLQPVEKLAGTNRLNLAIGLSLRNREALTNLLHQIYDPASPKYRRYLTPDQFTERFGPTERDYQAVIAFARANGLTVSGTHPNRMIVDVNATAADIETAFHVTLHTYQHPTEARRFYAPNAEPSLDLAVPVLHISGLDDYVLPHPCLKATPLDRANQANPANGSGPGGGYMGYDFRNAYAPGVALTGTGQKVGLLEFDGYYPHDIAAYLSMAGLPSVTLSNVLLNGFNGAPGGANVEVALDIDMAICMAPGLSEVIVYEGFVPDDVLNRMATDNLAKQLSSSWGWSPLDAIAVQIFQQFAAQGQSMFQASGDSDAWVGAIFPPSDDPYITVVGGTTLTMTAYGGAWLSEKVWNWGGGTGSGGGISTRYAIPSWQQGLDMTANQGSTTMRNIPDVALTADNVFIIANNGKQLSVGGTSAAAPLWAGFTALANQLALANGEPVVGFINPAVYEIGKGGGYTANFHDITTGNNESPSSPTKFSAVPGYDLCTGWGTPIGSNLVYSLGLPEPLRLAPAEGLLFTGPVGGPFSPTVALYSMTNHGSAPLNWRLGQAAPWLNASPASGTLTPGGPAVTVTVQPTPAATNLEAGSYATTLWFTNLSDGFVQRRQVTLAVVTMPLIISQPDDQPVLQGMTATFSVGTGTNALLFYQWQYDNGMYLTNLTDVGNISGSSSSTLTISNASPANVGAYSVIVSNAAGVAVSSNAFLTIIPWRPVITAQPTNQTVLPGAAGTFAVGAVGSQPFSYRWQQNGVNLTDGGKFSGTATSTLTVSNVTPAEAATYSVIVSNSLGTATSAGAALAVISVTAPGITMASLYSFTGGNDGANPYAPLVQAIDGNFYSTTYGGGTYGYGNIFRMTTNGALTVAHSFNYSSDGAYPYAGLAQYLNGSLFGLASSGGRYGDGVAFQVWTNGTFTALASFNYSVGAFPVAGLVLGTNGFFYGTTLEGGADGYGTVFRLLPSGGLFPLVHFHGVNGAYPSPVLIQGADGNFYGTTENGGAKGGWGTVFKMTPGGVLTTLYSFSYSDGGAPVPGLVQDTDGSFYGTTYFGGTNGYGTVFRMTPQGALTTLYAFTGGSDGGYPFGGLLLGTDGNLYGTTESGGIYSDGTVFRIGPEGALTTLVQFEGYNGANPEATLVQAADGSVYGTTQMGGTSGEGTVFRLSMGGPLQITSQPATQLAYAGANVTFSVATFGSLPVSYQWQKNGQNLTDGGNLSGSSTRALMLTNVTTDNVAIYSVIVSNAFGAVSSDDALLQVIVSPPQITAQPTNQTLVAGATALFSVQALGDLPLFYQWQENGTNLTDGGNISGSATSSLILGGVTAANDGVYSVIVSNALGAVASDNAALAVVPVTAPGTALGNLHNFISGSDGVNPYAGLVQGKDGNLYGTTYGGGTYGYGTAYKVTLKNILTILHPFSAGNDGANPYAGLVQGADGSFYGAAFQGGADQSGAIFRMSAGGAITPLYPFTGGNEGSYPVATLTPGADGRFYGTTYQGGTNGYGAVFAIATNGVFTPLFSFNSTNGAYPIGALVQGLDGSLYGTTYLGGTNGGFGTVFRITTNGALTSLFSFNSNNGAYPAGGLVQAPDGSLYGTTANGGTNGGFGTIFRATTNGTMASLVSFAYTNGANPYAGLVFGTDGGLYGTTSYGGLGGQGTLFRVTTNGLLTTLLWFTGPNGANPQDALVQASDGNFYGTTQYGGVSYAGAAYTGYGTIFRFTVPGFIRNPFTLAPATVGLAYGGAVATNAVAPHGDTLSFSKISGPAWLSVGSDGTLSGTPANTDIGTNTFFVSVTDTAGWYSTATVFVPVVGSPWITAGISRQGANLFLSWSGGRGPYQVQVATDLANPAWVNIGGPLTTNSLVLTPSPGAAFYRIQGQ